MQPVTLMAVALSLLGAASVEAQAAWTVLPESRVILLGKSNVNSWSCATSTLQTSIALDTTGGAEIGDSPRATVRLIVVVPVKSLDCGRARMNQNMFRALKADSFPEIRYVLTAYQVTEPYATTESFTIASVGELTVAGKTRQVDIGIEGVRNEAGGFRGAGGVKLLMTDFGIKPPTAFLGAIRTKNVIEVRAEIRVTRSDAVALRK